MSGAVRGLIACAVGALAAGVTVTALRQVTRTSPRWVRSNYRGRSVHLAAGPALVIGGCLGALTGTANDRAALAVVAAGGIAGVAGLLDDLAGDAVTKGLRGHLRALARGRATSGVLKIPLLLVAGGAAGAAVHGFSARAVLDAVFVAGAANLVNLLDLRPGRALKVLLAGSVACLAVGAAAAAGPLGAGLALLPSDLRERVMIGDAGANGAGAAVAATALAAIKLPTLLVALVIVVALTLLSEWVSFSRVIDRTPVLSWVDRLGRAP